MAESTVYTQRTYVLSNPDESSVVHTQRNYVLSNPNESSVVLSQRNYVLSNPNESSVVLSQRVYIVSVDSSIFPEEIDEIGAGSITFRANNATGIAQSPFTYKQQVFKHQGERWEVDVIIPSTERDLAQDWAARLVRLRGKSGKILIGDPDHATQRGTATEMTVTGNAGDSTITVSSLNGTLKAGDHFQLGSEANSRLHMVLVDKASGAGTLEIWPPLRTSYSTASATLTEPKGTFRLASNVTDWSIDNASMYGISFSAVEDFT